MASDHVGNILDQIAARGKATRICVSCCRKREGKLSHIDKEEKIWVNVGIIND